ncbi:hypothetical protein K523DRAFT_422218 [Schizophyllum commune Tattone D]|nr:hypothetical protein K523DRAFT_422218 [Schizophyllum commune Tattone D]
MGELMHGGLPISMMDDLKNKTACHSFPLSLARKSLRRLLPLREGDHSTRRTGDYQ